MADLRLGLNLWSQASDWPSFLGAALRADELGYDHIWTWDHVQAIFGDPDQPILEGYTALAAIAAGDDAGAARPVRRRQHLPQSRARGQGDRDDRPHQRRPRDHGPRRGVVRPRAPVVRDRLRQSGSASDSTGSPSRCPIVRDLLDGQEVTSTGPRYAIDHLRILPRPVQAHVPVMIGGGGERKTLRIVAQYADMWNVFGTPEVVAHKDGILRQHCADVGRDPDAIERTLGCKITIRSTEAEAERVRRAALEHNRTPLSRVEGDVSFWTGTPEQIAETMIAYRKVGFDTFIVELPAPYDAETMESLMTVVKPMVSPVAR